MLVIQKAVIDAEAGTVNHPADSLDEMRVRFMTYGTRSPFSLVSRLRVYGKRVRDSTTCLGYITWADDHESVSYKNVCNLTMEDLRKFVRDQVRAAQSPLEELLLLHAKESREDLGMGLWM